MFFTPVRLQPRVLKEFAHAITEPISVSFNEHTKQKTNQNMWKDDVRDFFLSVCKELYKRLTIQKICHKFLDLIT